jgi:hypothetical protein
MESDLQRLFGLHVHSCTHWLGPGKPPPPHLGSYTRALLFSQDRRHLFVTPWLGVLVKPISTSWILAWCPCFCFLLHASVYLFSYKFLTVDKLCWGCTPGPTENWGLLVKIASHTSFQIDKEKIYLYLVAEKIDELAMRKIPQSVQAESARFVVLVYSSVISQPPYEIHLPVNTALVLFSLSSTICRIFSCVE